MNIDYDKLGDFIKTGIQLREEGKPEAVSRHHLSSFLPQIFLDNPPWIYEHISGAEAKTSFHKEKGSDYGFIDSLVGKTAIEYEPDLRSSAAFQHGRAQVCDYCAGLLNSGCCAEDIIGILSDTLRWYAYRVHIISEPKPKKLYGQEHIELEELEHVFLDEDMEKTMILWPQFMEKYLGRIGARNLSAVILARDFGLEGIYCRQHISDIEALIRTAFDEKPQYAEMISNLWMNFVLFVGGMQEEFSIRSYSREYYIITLAKILCANIINQSPIVGSEQEIISILNGNYFKERGFDNFVEYDYFGWINDTPYVNHLISTVRSLQSMLMVYDYTDVHPEDMFFGLVSQMADGEQRILLGQDGTPPWLVAKITGQLMSQIEEYPRFIDMCCGSGAFLVEVLRHTERKYQIDVTSSGSELQILMQSILGFDIDPLAVMLSRANWMIFMSKYIPYLQESGLIIPVFHADSLFSKTPVSRSSEDSYRDRMRELNFGGKTILLPRQLLLPQNRRLYTYLVEQCHRIAENRGKHPKDELEALVTEPIVDGILSDISAEATESEREELESFTGKLVCTLEGLERDGLDGIWAYVLSNTYRPAMVAGQFNGVISNPPWLAMSKIKNNPYKDQLRIRAEHLELMPEAASVPHLELATIFMVQAVRYYLQPDASFACVVPRSVLNGRQHEPFRKWQYHIEGKERHFNIRQIWEVDERTFKNKAVVLFGDNANREDSIEEFSGKYVEREKELNLQFVTLHSGKRSAWTCQWDGGTICAPPQPIYLREGADIMYRALIFFEAEQQPNRRWHLQSIESQNSPFYYLISNQHFGKNFSVNSRGIHNACMYQCYLSKHLVSFVLSCPAAAFLPIARDEGTFRALRMEEYTAMGESTSVLIERVLNEGGYTSTGEYFKKRLNVRSKLGKQRFRKNTYVVVSSAGGTRPCAAYIPVTEELEERMVIDQTLYWTVTEDEREAIYIVGMLNSQVIADATNAFQPEGLLGKRHVHTIPFDMTPQYEKDSVLHEAVVIQTRQLMDELLRGEEIAEIVDPQTKNLQWRREKMWKRMNACSHKKEYEMACYQVLAHLSN